MSRKRPAPEPPETEEDDILGPDPAPVIMHYGKAGAANSETISKCLQTTGHLVQLLATAHTNAESRTNVIASESRQLSLLSRAMGMGGSTGNAAG